MSKSNLRIATCQFPVSSSISRNARRIRQFMQQAKSRRADLVHFSECALSGYAGVEHENLDTLDWDALRDETRSIMALARDLELWVILGSTHYLAPKLNPHNSLYLINNRGCIVDRYDKRFCTERDLEYYSPGNHFVTFTLHGIKCALLICFDLRFPELYRKLKTLNVECIFQSFYNARMEKRTIHVDIMRQTMQCRAATNYFWISMTNSSAYYSSYPGCFIQPDGKIVKQLTQHRSGLMVNTVTPDKKFYDAAASFRDLAIKGILQNGPTPNTPRSKNRTCL